LPIEKAKTKLFGDNEYKPDMKEIFNREDFFLQVPMLSEKALYNNLMIYTTMENTYYETNSLDLNNFFRDVQYNPFNSGKIMDFLLFSLWEANYILNENPKNYRPLVVDPKRLILEYPRYTMRRSTTEILGNFVDKNRIYPD
jgi:hypothetical protein